MNCIVYMLVLASFASALDTFDSSNISNFVCNDGVTAPSYTVTSICSKYYTYGCCEESTNTTATGPANIDYLTNTLSESCQNALIPLYCEAMCSPFSAYINPTVPRTFTNDDALDDTMVVTCSSACTRAQQACGTEVTFTCPTDDGETGCIGSGVVAPMFLSLDSSDDSSADDSNTTRSMMSPQAACTDFSCLSVAQRLNQDTWAFAEAVTLHLDATQRRTRRTLDDWYLYLRAHAPYAAASPFEGSGLGWPLGWFIGGVVMILLFLLTALCTRSLYPSAKVTPVAAPAACRIEPEGVEFDALTSKVFMGHPAPPRAAQAAHIADIPNLQRGVLYSHPLATRAWLPLAAGVLAACVWVLCPLSPLFMDSIDGRILGYGALHPDVMASSVATAATLLGTYWAFAKIGDRTFISVAPLCLALFLLVGDVALLSYFLYKAIDCMVQGGATSEPTGIDCTGTPGSLIFTAVLLPVVAYLSVVTIKRLGFAWANPSVLAQPGLPVVFTDAHQRLLLSYLDATRMNTRPEAGAHFTMEDLAVGQKRSSAAGPRRTAADGW